MIKQIPAHTNNYGIGRNGYSIDKIIIHWIAGTLESADATFQNPLRLASAHYGIGDDEVHQYVQEKDTAWHAGNLTVNRQSIGIEHEGGPNIPISEATYQSSAKLVKEICERYSIPLDREHIKGHNEIKATQCPGTFDINKLINIASGIINDMTDDQKRALNIIEEYKTKANHGNLEGAASAAVGAANDSPKKDEQILTLTNKVHELEIQVIEINKVIEEIKLNYIEKEKEVQKWQKVCATANANLNEQILKNEELDRLAKDNRNLYLQKNDEFNAYKLAEKENIKSEIINEISIKELFSLLIKKLLIKK